MFSLIFSMLFGGMWASMVKDYTIFLKIVLNAYHLNLIEVSLFYCPNFLNLVFEKDEEFRTLTLV